MSAITPESYIKLVRFDVTKENQITFPDGVAQVNYFKNTLEGIEAEDFTYIRQEQKIRFPYIIDQIEKYNYLIVQNLPYNYKYYFYYITDMKYVNDNMTDVFIKLDVFQTYQFDFIYKKSFIEREHVNNDSIGLHTVPEGLETGDFIIDGLYEDLSTSKVIYLVQCKKDLGGHVWSGTTFGNIFFQGVFYACGNPQSVFFLVSRYLEDETESLQPEDIVNIYCVPSFLIWDLPFEPGGTSPDNYYQLSSRYAISSAKQITINKASSLDGYVPKNKKLLTADYCYCLASNKCGGNQIYKYENFKTSNCNFYITGIPSPGVSMYLTPVNYENAGNVDYNAQLYALANGKFSISDVSTDRYQSWLSHNTWNIATAQTMSLAQVGLGIGEVLAEDYAGGFSQIASGISRISELTRGIFEKAKVPAGTVGHTSNGDVLNSRNLNCYVFYKMSIKKEYAQIIDEYFSRFGYKINLTKVPNITGRRYFNYVKTAQAEIESTTVPEKYLNEFKEMLNKGITFWHDPNHFLDYDVNNTIL